MPITNPHYGMPYSNIGQRSVADHDDSLTPVDKSPRKLHLGHAHASKLLIKPLAPETMVPTPVASKTLASSLTSMMAATATRRASCGTVQHRSLGADSDTDADVAERHNQQQFPPLDRRRVSFEIPNSSYMTAQEPPQKRRRFQRRNSKTAAMLFSSMAKEIAVCSNNNSNNSSGVKTSHDDGPKTVEMMTSEPHQQHQHQQMPSQPATTTTSEKDSAWDGGLEIAEELVRQLKLRRRSNSFGSRS
eukprot:CAMPEP_0119561348 /NCGR_PEP_ID=MMETSP1352-20130426/17282_1 /TAXON_ID=265584 /ORGANISM="Stauroneis constricta, Strain CCMP1120" /LENGTH=245 /DNA_ID=CAMNT_0007609525 /DNA_START=99 /DNA_END=836 /DNA_ORIENTATION=+